MLRTNIPFGESEAARPPQFSDFRIFDLRAPLAETVFFSAIHLPELRKAGAATRAMVGLRVVR